MRPSATAVLAAATSALVALVPGTAAGVSDPAHNADRQLKIVVLSNRADLVSGGDALVEAVLPPGAAASGLRVQVVDGPGVRDVSGAFARRADGRIVGLVEGLPVGRITLRASVDGPRHGRTARLTVTNSPSGGPVFSGPQVMPWVCTTQNNGLGPPRDAQCGTEATYRLFYRRTTGGFAAYDPANPPADVATTTTDAGVTVPYVFRQETGTQNRGIYRIAVLFDPARPWTAWDTQPGWNHKLFYPFGANCNTYHTQGDAQNVQIDRALSRGFMVATSSLNVLGGNCNSIVSAESVMMLKERIAERYGRIRYTFAQGLSGGSIQQHEIANAYPGLLDGIQPNASYEDMWSGALTEVDDCHLLLNAFNTVSPALWTDRAARAAVQGNAPPVNPADRTTCESWDPIFTDFQNPASSRSFPPAGPLPPFFQSCFPAPLTPEQVAQLYDPVTNPAGCRSTFQDFSVGVFGQRPRDTWTAAERAAGFGFAKLPFDNVGVQYGLQALRTGAITPEQFVDVNEHIGGVDVDHNFTPRRSVADVGAIQTAYRSGITQDATRLDNVAIIDLRANNNLNDIHAPFHTYTLRERLRNANGHANNQIIWTFPGPGIAPPDPIADEAFLSMDRWLAGVEADHTNAPLNVKILRHKPATAVDACFIGGTKVTDPAACRATFPHYADPRIAAGAPLSNDLLKCALKPLRQKDYSVPFTPPQWSRLQAAFPRGVCDYRKPGVERVPSVAWQTYAHGPDGRPLGPAPVSG